MLSPLSLAQKNLSEDGGTGFDAESGLDLKPETDRFGFILTNGSTAGSVGPSPELVRQREAKWINIIFQWDHMLLKKTNKVKVQCQKGIPASLRAKCWPLLCAATDRMKLNKNLYKSLDSQPALQSWVDVIERDLDRQFPFHEMFLCKDGHGQRGLFRVLKAYTQFRPEEGYCQAQGPVAAVLLMNMPAEEAFWCLVQISEQYLPGYYSPLLEGVLFDAGMLTWVLRRTCPAAHKHLQHHGVEPLMFATDWLMCLFTRHLPFNTLLRVWDLFFCNGVQVLLKVAVVLVRRVLGRAQQRKQCQGQMETLERLRGVREQVHEDDDIFIAEVCSVPLSVQDLEKQTEKELEKWRRDKPSSTFDPRGRCHGYRMAWARAQHSNEDQDRKEREKGNLSVPLSRSASTLSLSPSLFHKRWRKGRKVNTGAGGAKVVRHLSMGATEDWRSWNENFKKVKGVQEEDDAEYKKTTTQLEEKELSDKPKKTEKVQNIQTEEKEETENVKEQNDQAETEITEMEGNQSNMAEKDKMLSDQMKVIYTKTEQNQGPTKDQSVENILQSSECTSHYEQEKRRVSKSQSLVLETETQKDAEHESDKPATECEHSAAMEENWSETRTDVIVDTYIDKKMEADSSEGQAIQAELKQEVETERKHELQMQVDIASEVLQTRMETIPGSDTKGNTNAATFSDPNPAGETETKEEETTETDQSSKFDVFKENHHSTESLTGIEMKEESNNQTETDTEEKVDGHVATQSELETKQIHSKTVNKTETPIMSSPKCIHQQEDTESKAEMPVTDDTMKEITQAFTQCSVTECDSRTTEPTEEKEETTSSVHSEFDETTLTETTDSAAPAVKEESLEQPKEGDLTTEPNGKTSSVENNFLDEPEHGEPTSQLMANSSEEKEHAENVEEDPKREDIFMSSLKLSDNPHTDTNPHRQDEGDVPAELDNSGLTQNCSQIAANFCARRYSSSHGSKVTHKLSNDLFTPPQKTNQPQSNSDHAEVKQIHSQSHPGAVDPTQTSPKVTQSSKVTLSAEITQGKAAEQEQPAVPKRFGLFQRLRGEHPKKAKGKEAHKLQVPIILIQDFSDGTGKVVKEGNEEKLSSRERRRRRREKERQEKEEERLRKKNEKEMGKERERRKPQTRGKSFQVQKRDIKDPQGAKTGSQTLRFSASYADSYF